MKTNLVNYLLYILFIVGIYGSGKLAYHEFLKEGTCPKLVMIPACYIILACFIIPFLTLIANRGKLIYFLFTGFALTLATYATIGQLIDKVQCPKTESGIPMCYISLALFTCLFLLKIILLNKKA